MRNSSKVYKMITQINSNNLDIKNLHGFVLFRKNIPTWDFSDRLISITSIVSLLLQDSILIVLLYLK